jgi:hypothetical protein
MDEVFCRACGIAMDSDDNFCRRCGAGANISALPTLRKTSTPTVWRPPTVTPAVKGAMVMAAGTVGQFLLRRAVTGVFGGGRPNNAKAIQIRRPRERDGMVDEAQVITETVMMRRVRIRRPS